jgi:hypothetical protein
VVALLIHNPFSKMHHPLLGLAVFALLVAALPAEVLRPGDLGPAGPLAQAIRHGNLRVISPAGTMLVRADLDGIPVLGVAGGLADSTVSAGESITVFFDRPHRIDSMRIGGFGASDSVVLVAGFPSDPGASLSNGTATFANGTVTLSATGFAAVSTINFAAPVPVDLLALSNPQADPSGGGVSLVQIDHTPQPQVLYREEFPNGLRVSRPLADCGWDAFSAMAPGIPPEVVISPTPTTVNAADLGTGNLGASANAGGLVVSTASGGLFVGVESTYTSIGIAGGFKDTTISQGENFNITPADAMVVDQITFAGFGANDSPVVISGFPANPGASLDNGNSAFSGNAVTLTATTFSALATVSFANPVILSTVNIRSNSTNGGAGGVGIPSITYRSATNPFHSTAHIAGVFGDDHAVILNAADDGDFKAIISTEEDWIHFDPARYAGMELRWEQAGGSNGADVVVRPMIEVGGQWFASATAFPVVADNSPFADKSLALTTLAADWMSVSLGENSATPGAPPATDLTGPITNLGFFADFSADEQNQVVLLDRLELAGHPLFPDEEPWTFVSSPDFTNSDTGDLSGAITGLPPSSGWDGGINGTTAEIEDSFLAFLQTLTSEAPDLFLVAGDLVEGEWFKDAPGRQLLGPVNSNANRELAFVEGSFYYYGHYQNAWFRRHGLRVIACVGDHELGDNDWSIGGNNTALIPIMRSEFSRWFTRFPIGQWSTYTAAGRPNRAAPDFMSTPAPLIYPDRPIGSPHEQTAFAIRHKDTLIVSLDVFRHTPNTSISPNGTVKAELEAGQLAWIQALLADAAADPSIRHIVTQCHTPILQPVINTSSSGMTYSDGESSPLFQAMIANGVDLHFSGEVHDIAASRHLGVQQIVHGSPPGSRLLNYLVVRVHPDKLDCTIKTGRQYRDNSVPKFAPTNGNNNDSGFAEMREPFKAAGSILIDKSGERKTISEGTGPLVNIEHDDYLIHYSFDHPPGTRTMPNEGTLPSVSADNLKKWRGDLDTNWLASPDFVPGKFGSALRFAGLGGNPDEVLSGEAPTPLGKPRTMAFWLRTSHAGFQNIAGFGDNRQDYAEFTAQIATDGRLQLDIGSYTAAALGGPPINDGQWHHCAIVVPAWDRSTLGEVLFYIGGVPYASETSNPGIAIRTRTTSSAGHLRIGCHALNTNSPYQGELDDFVVWGRALSTAELSLIHAFGTSSLNYDVAKADPLLKAFRAGRGVEIDGVTWFHVASGLRGAAGKTYDLDGNHILPLAEGSGMTTFDNEFQRALSSGRPTVDLTDARVSLTWNSLPGATYDIESSDDLMEWKEVPAATNIASQGTATTHRFIHDHGPKRRFYRVRETP